MGVYCRSLVCPSGSWPVIQDLEMVCGVRDPGRHHHCRRRYLHGGTAKKPAAVITTTTTQTSTIPSDILAPYLVKTSSLYYYAGKLPSPAPITSSPPTGTSTARRTSG